MASLKKRGKKYYASYYVNGREQRKALDTENYQVAKQRLRNLDSAQSRGVLDDTLPRKVKIFSRGSKSSCRPSRKLVFVRK